MNRAEFIKKTILGLSAWAVAPKLSWAENFEITAGEAIINPHFVARGNGFGNRIALTYDDGPTPGVTDIVLKELDKRNLRATFFMIGKKAELYPSLAKEVADAGHEVANHTYTHAWLNRLSNPQVEYEIKKAQEVIVNTTGKIPQWFRPPYGAFNKERQGEVPLSLGLGIAYWSVDPRDWAQPGVSSIVSRVMGGTTPGSIILLHDLHKQTADATGSVLERLKEKAFSLANLTRFLGKPYPG